MKAQRVHFKFLSYKIHCYLTNKSINLKKYQLRLNQDTKSTFSVWDSEHLHIDFEMSENQTCHFQKLVACAWVLALVCCIPQILIFNAASLVGCKSGEVFEKCQTNFPTWLAPSQYILYFSFTNFFIPLLVLLFSNCFICKTIWTSSSTS